MALTDAELVTTAEIIEENYEATQFSSGNLTEAQEASLRADLDTWAGIRDKHLKIKGGKDGVDLDNDRQRAAIRKRLRLMLLRSADSLDAGIRIVRG